jgi:hypothetical protein
MLVRKCGDTLRHMMMQLNGYKGNNMSLGGSSESSQQLDPALRDLFLQNYQGAQGTASGLQARQFAGFNPDQQRAFELSRQFADPNSEVFAGMRKAATAAETAANYAPQQVASRDVSAALAQGQGYQAAQAQGQGYTAAQAQAAQLGRGAVRDVNAERIAAERIAAAQAQRSGARDVSSAGVTGQQVAQEALGAIAPQARANIRDIAAGSFLNQNIEQYMNPFTKAVTEQSLADLERSRLLQQQQTAAQATAARAFGGSRQGVAEAETNRAFGENAARLVAQQNAAGYEAAQRASEADLARQMQAQQLNQAQDLATTQQSLQLAGQFGLANQDAALRAALANQGVDVQYGLSNAQLQQQAALANQATGLTAAQANQDAMLKAALSNQGYDFNVGQMNTMNQQQTALANQAALNQASQFGASAANQAALSNQAALNQAGQFGAGASNQAALANQAAQNQIAQQNAANFLQANLANQGAGLSANQQRIAASGQLANISQGGQQMGFAGANQLAQQGAVQQQFSQAQLDAIRNLPLEQQQILNQALGINVGGGSGMQSTSSSGQGLFGLFR